MMSSLMAAAMGLAAAFLAAMAFFAGGGELLSGDGGADEEGELASAARPHQTKLVPMRSEAA